MRKINHLVVLALLALTIQANNVTEHCHESVVNGVYEYNCNYPEDLTKVNVLIRNAETKREND